MIVQVDLDLCIAVYDANIHAGVLARRGQLESAIAAPFASFGGFEAYPTLLEKAARLAWGIAAAQAYTDGNKRLAWMMSMLFLRLNGVVLIADQAEAAEKLLLAGSRAPGTDEPMLSPEEFTEWFVSHAYSEQDAAG